MRRKKQSSGGGVFENAVFFLFSLGFFGSGALLLWAAALPVPDLRSFDERKISQSTKIYDRTGEVLLYDIHENVQRTVVPFDDISRHVKNATVAIEDAEFYGHRGVKPTAVIRALLSNLRRGDIYGQGGSTITQQVVKNSLLTSEKKIARKLKEWILAIKLEQAVGKEAIIELYLNEVPYGGNLYGVEEASKAFFDKRASELSLAESAYLAALPQAPTFYSPYGNNFPALEERKNLVLDRMLELGFAGKEEYETAHKEKVFFQPRGETGIKAPHFVFYVREQLEGRYGKDVIEKGGLRVTTTLDYELQKKAEEIVAQYAEENVEKYNAHNAGLVAIDPQTGHILAMVGSKDYFDAENDGNFNVTLARRQPGSAFKPFVYATALMKGYTPETVVFDLKTQFHSGCDTEGKPLFDAVGEEECYMPENYDGVFRGPVTFREALAQSINVPAVKVLYLAGVKDSINTARSLGITSLADKSRYGLTLVLGGGEVSLLEMTSAYAAFANDGIRNPHTPILKIVDGDGNVLEKWSPDPRRAVPENTAGQISDILSDNDARAPAFGERSYLYFDDRDVAAKTGTTNDYRDAWIIGYAPNFAVGAWAGNNDNAPMEKKVAGFIIAPLWNAFMTEALADVPKKEFKKPKAAVRGGLKPVLRGEWLGSESYFIDTVSGKRATEYTPSETRAERFVANVHSILNWVEKDAPEGPPPPAPEKDPQFALWEKPVREWAGMQNIIEGTSTVPALYDPVHKPEFFPQIEASGINEEQVYAKDRQIRLVVSGTSAFGLSKIDLFINGIYAGSTKTPPYAFSFMPEEIIGLQKENVVKIIAHDTVWNRGGKTLTLKVDM